MALNLKAQMRTAKADKGRKGRKGDLMPQGSPLYIYTVFERFSSLYRSALVSTSEVHVSTACL